jgi:hypothetical protein
MGENEFKKDIEYIQKTLDSLEKNFKEGLESVKERVRSGEEKIEKSFEKEIKTHVKYAGIIVLVAVSLVSTFFYKNKEDITKEATKEAVIKAEEIATTIANKKTEEMKVDNIKNEVINKIVVENKEEIVASLKGKLNSKILKDIEVIKKVAFTYVENGHYYRSPNIKLTWSAAKDYCIQMGGHLATITSKEENDFVKSNIIDRIKGNYWLGGTDEDSEGNWKWINKEGVLIYSNWYKGEPNNGGGKGEDYLIFWYAYGQWADYGLPNNDPTCFFICEWDK